MGKNTEEGTSQALRVVIADDEPIIVMNLAEILAAKGFQVVGSAMDGFEAIELCRKQNPDIALLDIKMPLLDGLTAAQIIFEERLADTIIILSAFHDTEYVERASEIGVVGYLIKPINEDELLPCIKVGRARSRELRHLQSEIEEAHKAIEARKSIERAKGVVMNRQGLSESEAYAYIREISKQKSISMERVSEILIRGMSS